MALEKLTSETASSQEGPQEETIGIFGGHSSGSDAAHLSRAARMKRLGEMLSIVSHYDIAHGLTPKSMRLMLEELGPTFVKAGQILSMRSEILPQAFCDELSKLRTDAEPMSYEEVLHTLRSEYERPLEEIFDAIDPEPLGSASIAQVHIARLIDGQDVAVKIQRPGVRETMAQDVSIMRSLARRAQHVLGEGFVDIQSVIEELWTSFREETDFLIEAHNLEEFRQNNADIAFISCPAPYLSLCTSHVVVMEYIRGTEISATQALIDQGYDMDEIGTKLVDNYTRQIIDDGFFHADPHPGNILISGGKIVFLDLGMMGRLSAHYRSAMRQMVVAVAEKDAAKLKDGLLEFALNTDVSGIDHGAMLADLDAIVNDFGTQSLSDLDLGAFVMAIVNLANHYGVELPGTVTMLARSLVTLEGVLEKSIPSVSMIDIVRQHLKSSTDMGTLAERELKSLLLESRSATHGILGAATESKLAMRMLTRGQLSFTAKLGRTEDPIGDMARAADRLTMGIVIAGLFIGSSVVYYARIQPVIFGIPVIGFFGYVVALGLGMWIVRQIMKESRRR